MAAGWPASAGGHRDPPRNGERRHADRLGARFADLTKVADAILYEGYLLYPYRRSSTKNRGQRWQFGVLSPKGSVMPDDDSVAGSVESWFQQTQCLIERPRGDLAVQIRFLQLRHKTIKKLRRGGSSDVVRELEVDGVLHIGFAEAIPRTYGISVDADGLAASPLRRELCYPACETSEPILDPSGKAVGVIERHIMPLSARFHLDLSPARAAFPLHRLTIRAENTARARRHDGSREEALARSLISTHTLIGIDDGAFLSQLDPPQWARDAIEECHNIHTFPVLAGNRGTQGRMISSPIILYDYPQVAPESPGDLFDATEIDEILSLRTMTMSDDEKREARATDPRAAAVVDRVDSMPPEMLAKLHGAVRSLRPVNAPPAQSNEAPPWWASEADSAPDPANERVSVLGGEVGRGSVVRLHPRSRGTDAHDMFLAGRLARVHAVLVDVDGARQIAVTIEDDPAAELHQWYGRLRYFAPTEVEALPGLGSAS